MCKVQVLVNNLRGIYIQLMGLAFLRLPTFCDFNFQVLAALATWTPNSFSIAHLDHCVSARCLFLCLQETGKQPQGKSQMNMLNLTTCSFLPACTKAPFPPMPTVILKYCNFSVGWLVWYQLSNYGCYWKLLNVPLSERNKKNKRSWYQGFGCTSNFQTFPFLYDSGSCISIYKCYGTPTRLRRSCFGINHWRSATLTLFATIVQWLEFLKWNPKVWICTHDTPRTLGFSGISW